MGRRILQVALAATAAAVVVICGLWIWARPAAMHPYFAADDFMVIAHRGGRGLGPENTLPAFRLSLAAGANVLEMDVRTTADGHFIVLHDGSVDRTTNGHGTVNEMTLAQVKKLDAGYHWTVADGRGFPFRNRGITIPTLPEVFTAVPVMPLIIELKENRPSMSQSFCAELRKHKRTNSVLVASAHSEVLERFRTVCPRVATSSGPTEAMQFYLLSRMGLASLYSPVEKALLVPKTVKGRQVVSIEFVEAAHARNLKVAVWTINRNEDMRRLIAVAVDGILTDYPDRLSGIIKEMP